MSSLTVQEYSEKAIVVRGSPSDIEAHMGPLVSIGGTHNSRLRDGPGIIFSKRYTKQVGEYLTKAATGATQVASTQASHPIPTSSLVDSDLMGTVKQAMKKMTPSERLLFIRDLCEATAEMVAEGKEGKNAPQIQVVGRSVQKSSVLLGTPAASARSLAEPSARTPAESSVTTAEDDTIVIEDDDEPVKPVSLMRRAA